MGLLSKWTKSIKKVIKKVIPKEVTQAPTAILGAGASLLTGNVGGAVASLASPFLGDLGRMSQPRIPQQPGFPSVAGVSGVGILDTAAKIGQVIEGLSTARGVLGLGSGGGASVPATSGGVAYGVPGSVVAPQAGVDKYGRPILLPITYHTVSRPAPINGKTPSGYVIVSHPTAGKIAMLKGAARAAGLWAPKRKPPISAAEWRQMKVAERVKKKVKRITRAAGYIPATRGRSTGTRKKR